MKTGRAKDISPASNAQSNLHRDESDSGLYAVRELHFQELRHHVFGGLAETFSCYFENVRWIFEGAAGTIVTVMQGLGWKIIPPQ